jgi:hypothetical protein
MSTLGVIMLSVFESEDDNSGAESDGGWVDVGSIPDSHCWWWGLIQSLAKCKGVQNVLCM